MTRLPRSPRLVLVGGGVRSGKSHFAEGRAEALGSRRAYVATAQAFDDEMRTRIGAHRRDRGDRFDTFEEPLHLVGQLRDLADYDVVLVDCLTLWLSNLLLADRSDGDVEAEVGALVAHLAESGPPVVLVTNEVGMGIVPEHALGRRFRDLAGRMHQRLAAMADEVYLAAMGLVLRLVPGPVEPVPRQRAPHG